MENLLLQNLKTLIPSLSDPSSPRRLQTLTLARSLLTNPSSSPQTLQSILDPLLQTLNLHNNDPLLVRHLVKILGDAAFLHRSLIPPVISAVRSVLVGGGDPRAAAGALAVLDSLSEDLVLDEETVLSLASSPAPSARSRAVQYLVDCPSMAPEIAVSLLLGLSGDIYPLVRQAAAEGMVKLLKKDGIMGGGLVVDCCYDCAIELLRDEDELVRSSAIRLISECGYLFAVDEAKRNNSELMDVVFTQISGQTLQLGYLYELLHLVLPHQLCSVARDMSLKVRTTAFIALGRVRIVSESVLLQSLSKKIMRSSSGKQIIAEYPIKESRLLLAHAAGVFVHGIEDEFHEVRAAACKSLGMLAVYSIQFAGGALNLLMDMLNNDSEAVRLQTLQTLFHMAMYDRLVVLEEHMHMFLGLLADISPLIRSAAREVLRLMKLPKLDIFLSAVDGLTTNLVTHPEEEEDILCALFFIGKNHGKFSAKRRVKEFKLEVEASTGVGRGMECCLWLFKTQVTQLGTIKTPSSAGELSLDCPQVKVLLVLAISSSFSDEQCTRDVPATIFAQTVPLFNKISHSLGGGMDSDLLLAYLFHHSEMAFPANSKSKEVELLPHIVEEVISNYKKRTDLICSFTWPVCIEISESSLKENLSGLSEASAYLEHSKQERECLAEEKTQSIKLILTSVKEIWPLMQSHCTHKVRWILRTCKEELEMITWSADGNFTAILAFASYYVQVMQLFAELWERLQIRKFHVVGTISVDLLLEKLEICLKRMKYGFPGLCREEECHILELYLLSYVLRIYNVGICSDLMLRKLLAAVSRLELLSGERSSELSCFSKELKNACMEGRLRKSPELFDVHKLITVFRLEQLPLCGRFRFINAELCSIGDNSENPLRFIPELPIGIMFQITLYNVSNKQRLWVRMAVGRSIQYAFIDLCLFEGSDEVRKCTLNLLFYATPKATSFQLKASVCMECLPEDFMLCRKVSRGPSHDVMQLSEEYDIYLIRMENE